MPDTIYDAFKKWYGERPVNRNLVSEEAFRAGVYFGREIPMPENCDMCGQSNWAERRLTIAMKALKDIKNLRGTMIPHSAGFEAGEIANKALDDIIFIRVKSEPVGASLSAQTPPNSIKELALAISRKLRCEIHALDGRWPGVSPDNPANKEWLDSAGERDAEIIMPYILGLVTQLALSGAAPEGDCPCGATVVRKSDSANKSKLCADCAAQEEAPRRKDSAIRGDEFALGNGGAGEGSYHLSPVLSYSSAEKEVRSPATYAQREKLTTVDSREPYIRAKLSTLVPSQIRAVRLKRGLSQKQLADLCGMKQARISEMETAGACNYTISTLARIAAAMGIALQIEFCTFAEMLNWENSYSQDSFDVTPITSGVVAEEEAGAPTENSDV